MWSICYKYQWFSFHSLLMMCIMNIVHWTQLTQWMWRKFINFWLKIKHYFSSTNGTFCYNFLKSELKTTRKKRMCTIQRICVIDLWQSIFTLWHEHVPWAFDGDARNNIPNEFHKTIQPKEERTSSTYTK